MLICKVNYLSTHAISITFAHTNYFKTKSVKNVCTVLSLMSWPENQGILFFYISKTLEMIRISFMASLLNAVL